MAAALVACAWLACGVQLLPDYGPVWDPVLAEYPYGECILESLATGQPTSFDPPLRSTLAFREPHPDFVLQYPFAQTHPFTAILSALSCRILWTELAWMDPIAAHNLPVVLQLGVLLFFLVAFVARRRGILTGVAAGLILCVCPRFFAHSFNNLRDAPEACLYGLASLATYLAITRGRLAWWGVAGMATAFAFAQKTPALFVPVQMGMFLILAWLWDKRHGRPADLLPWRGICVAALTFVVAYFVVSPPIWRDPIGQMGVYFHHVFAIGNWFTSDMGTLLGPEVPVWDLHGPLHVLLTTPPIVLVLGLLGAVAPGVDGKLRLFLLLWTLVPIARVSAPGMRDFDGVRHFLEFLPPLAILAAIGLERLLRLARAEHRLVRVAAVGAAVAPGLVVTAATHPNGICYYNGLIGGLGGAAKAGILDATDYWGNSYWQGLDWLNENAEPEAGLIVPVAEHVVACVVPVKLRADLVFLPRELVRSGDLRGPVYVMFITRPGQYGPMLVELLRENIPPAHTIRVQGGVILEILRLDEHRTARAADLLDREHRARVASMELLAWIQRDPARFAPVWKILVEVGTVGLEESERRLRALLPEDMHQKGSDVLWLKFHSR